MELELNLDPALCEKFSAYLEANEDARLAAVVPMVAHEAAQQDNFAG
jgi:hypothetical protein